LYNNNNNDNEILWRDPSRERKCRQPGNKLDFFVLMASARMGPPRYPGPEANRWHGMSLSLTLMQTLTSIALQSLPELQPIMQQQPSQPNMPILRLTHIFIPFVIETSGK